MSRPKGEPIPVRFDAEEDSLLIALTTRTGLTKSEIIRRAVIMLTREYSRRGNAGWIIDELSPQLRTTEEPGEYKVTKKKKQKKPPGPSTGASKNQDAA